MPVLEFLWDTIKAMLGISTLCKTCRMKRGTTENCRECRKRRGKLLKVP